YVINNDTLPGPLDEFTIYFDEHLFANLADATGPAGWDTLAIAPDTGIPAAGYLDGLALAGGIAAGDTLGGFSITFDFFGAGAPGAQQFSIVDPLTFVEIDSGVTGASAVPLPGTVPLMLAGLVSLACLRRHHGKGGLL
ncbi:MAG: hypothetical protein K2X55_23435, partial [Burkholderiaceae bacterium]|nr:hypothetical protein [Burkholderiaceae bacterium]